MCRPTIELDTRTTSSFCALSSASFFWTDSHGGVNDTDSHGGVNDTDSHGGVALTLSLSLSLSLSHTHTHTHTDGRTHACPPPFSGQIVTVVSMMTRVVGKVYTYQSPMTSPSSTYTLVHSTHELDICEPRPNTCTAQP